MKANPNWKRVSIKDVCESITDCVNKTASTVNYPTEFKMIRTTNVKKGWVDLSEVKYVTREVFERWTRRVIPKKGDIILTREAPLGEVGMLRTTDNIFLGQRLVQYRANPRYLDNRFLLYAFQGLDLQSQIKALGSGATVEHMRVPDAEKLTLLLPPLPTQHKIASILSAYDDLIENNTRRIAILEEMAQTIYQEWFVRFRYPGYEKNEMVESELGMIPEGWEIKRLADVCLRITDGSHWSPKTTIDGYPMASVKDMHDWGFHLDQCRKISKEDYQKLVLSDCKPLKGDVLIAKDGSYLKHNFVINKEIDLVILSSIAVLRTNKKIHPYLLSMYLSDPSVKLRMKGYVSGAALPRIILKAFANFAIPVAPEDIQVEFLKIIEPIMLSCYNITERNTNLRQTHDLLLPKLISGEIDVETLDIDIPDMPEPEAQQQNTAPIVQPKPIDASQLAFLF